MLIYKQIYSDIEYAIWRIDETLDTLWLLLDHSIYKDDKYLKVVTNKEKLREKLAVRVLLKQLLEKDIQIEYSNSGKPTLKNSNSFISISHTQGYIAVAIAKNDGIGIDIEKISNKVERVTDRFMNKEEYIEPENQMNHLLIHWSAKESMYKALDKKGIELNNNLLLQQFRPQTSGSIIGYTQNIDIDLKYEILYRVENDYVLTLAYPKK